MPMSSSLKEIRKLYTTPTHTITYKLGEISYIAQASHTLRVYDTTFNIIFDGPRLNKTVALKQANRKFYVAEGNKINVISRGECEKQIWIANNLVYNKKTKGIKIKAIEIEKDRIFILNVNGDLVYLDDYKVEGVISKMEIKFIAAGKEGLFFCNGTKIYQFTEKGVEIVTELNINESILDMRINGKYLIVKTKNRINVFETNNFRHIFKFVKKDKFDILDFSKDYFVYRDKNERVVVYDIKNKFKVDKLNLKWGCLYGDKKLFGWNEKMFIFDIRKNKCVVLHSRVLSISGGIADSARNTLVAINGHRIIGYQDKKCPILFSLKNFNDFKNSKITTIKIDEKILISDPLKCFLLDFENKNGKLIREDSNHQLINIGYEHPFYAYGRNKLYLCNVESSRILETCESGNILAVEIYKGLIYVGDENSLKIYDYKLNLIVKQKTGKVIEIKRIGEYLAVKETDAILVVSGLDIVRRFTLDFDLNYSEFCGSNKIIYVLIDGNVFVFDILIGELIERIKVDCNFIGISSLDEYLVFRTKKGRFILYSYSKNQVEYQIENKEYDNLNTLIKKDFIKAIDYLDECEIDKIGDENIELVLKKWDEFEEMVYDIKGMIKFGDKFRKVS